MSLILGSSNAHHSQRCHSNLSSKHLLTMKQIKIISHRQVLGKGAAEGRLVLIFCVKIFSGQKRQNTYIWDFKSSESKGA